MADYTLQAIIIFINDTHMKLKPIRLPLKLHPPAVLGSQKRRVWQQPAGRCRRCRSADTKEWQRNLFSPKSTSQPFPRGSQESGSGSSVLNEFHPDFQRFKELGFGVDASISGKQHLLQLGIDNATNCPQSRPRSLPYPCLTTRVLQGFTSGSAVDAFNKSKQRLGQ